MPVERVFVDTNVLLSGLVFRGNEARLLRLASAGEIRLVLAEAVLAEAREVLQSKFPKHSEALDRFLESVEYEFVPMPDHESLSNLVEICRDPDDVFILASIRDADPDWALTGDKDLLTANIRLILPICRCSDYLAARGGEPK